MENNKLLHLDQMCLECLTTKQKHTSHCKRCNKCVSEFHIHDCNFNKCIGRNNIRQYVLYLTGCWALSAIYCFMMIDAHWVDLEADNRLLKVMEMHFKMPTLMLIALVFAEVFFLRYMALCLAIYSAIWNGMTLNEFENAWQYKYLYKARRVKTHEGPKMFYFIKRSNLCQSICNCFQFCFATKAKEKDVEKMTS